MNKTHLSLRLKALAMCLAIIVATLAMASCQKAVTVDSDTMIIIGCTESDEGKMLIDYMNELKEDEKIDFTVENGMVSSINGVENAADYSSCWMLYTSDEEMANSAWGTVLYNDAEYGSAILGAEKLKIKDGCLYIWAFREASW